MTWDTVISMWEAGSWTRASLVFTTSMFLALLTSVVFRRVVLRLTRHTETELDDMLAQNLRRPVSASVLLIGAWYATSQLELTAPLPWVIEGLIVSIAAGVWCVTALRISNLLLDLLVRHREKFTAVTPRTLPVFEIAAKTLIYGGTLYFLFLAWDVDLTGWLASAGIVGIAVGFASKDTLSNLVAGVFILADAPYKLGDYIVLDSGERGRISEIGIRTTRMLTNDDVEIIVPNAVMANARIVNESGGPYTKFRIRIPVGVAYGSDVDDVRDVLMDVAQTTEGVETEPTPRVRFRSFGDSALMFELLCWVPDPRDRGRVTDKLLVQIYKRFRSLEIEIPYMKHDVYLFKGDDQAPELDP